MQKKKNLKIRLQHPWFTFPIYHFFFIIIWSYLDLKKVFYDHIKSSLDPLHFLKLSKIPFYPLIFFIFTPLCWWTLKKIKAELRFYSDFISIVALSPKKEISHQVLLPKICIFLPEEALEVSQCPRGCRMKWECPAKKVPETCIARGEINPISRGKKTISIGGKSHLNRGKSHFQGENKSHFQGEKTHFNRGINSVFRGNKSHFQGKKTHFSRGKK